MPVTVSSCLSDWVWPVFCCLDGFRAAGLPVSNLPVAATVIVAPLLRLWEFDGGARKVLVGGLSRVGLCKVALRCVRPWGTLKTHTDTAASLNKE